jgi:hypothetical protein
MHDDTKVKRSFRIFMGICVPLTTAYGALYTFIPSQYHRWIHCFCLAQSKRDRN